MGRNVWHNQESIWNIQRTQNTQQDISYYEPIEIIADIKTKLALISISCKNRWFIVGNVEILSTFNAHVPTITFC